MRKINLQIRKTTVAKFGNSSKKSWTTMPMPNTTMPMPCTTMPMP